MRDGDQSSILIFWKWQREWKFQFVLVDGWRRKCFLQLVRKNEFNEKKWSKEKKMKHDSSQLQTISWEIRIEMKRYLTQKGRLRLFFFFFLLRYIICIERELIYYCR